MSRGTSVALDIVISPGIEVKAIEGDSLLADRDYGDARADFAVRSFAGRLVRYAELHSYSLNESPFTNPKSMLRALELGQRITVKCKDEKRRKGTFPERLQDDLFVQFGESV